MLAALTLPAHCADTALPCTGCLSTTAQESLHQPCPRKFAPTYQSPDNAVVPTCLLHALQDCCTLALIPMQLYLTLVYHNFGLLMHWLDELSLSTHLDKLPVAVAVACVGVLAGTADLDSTSLACAALGEVTALPRLVHQGEAVEGTHHLALIGVHHTLWVGTLTNECHKQRGILIGGVPAGLRYHASQLHGGRCCGLGVLLDWHDCACCCLPAGTCCTTEAPIAAVSSCTTAAASCCPAGWSWLCSTCSSCMGSCCCLSCLDTWRGDGCYWMVHGCAIARKLVRVRRTAALAIRVEQQDLQHNSRTNKGTVLHCSVWACVARPPLRCASLLLC